METNTALNEQPENPAIIQVREWRKEGKKVGFVNGCFDLLHAGHVNLMNTARSNCDKLIVAVTSDEMVTKQKGKGRPIMSDKERAYIVNGLSAVDMVLIVSDETPMRILQNLKPELVVKGADYENSEFPEKSFIQSYGGKILYAPTINSSTDLINKCKKILQKKKN